MPARIRLALVCKAFAKHARKVLGRLVGERGVIAFFFAGQQHVQGVMEVVVPLRSVATLQLRGLVGLVFQHQMHMPASRQAGLDGLAQGVQKRIRRDRMHRIQAQAVEAIFVQPHQCVIEKISLHRRLAEIDRRAPRGGLVFVEERRSVAVQVITVRAEMVIDHIQQYHQAVPVRGIDQRLQVVGVP